MGGADERTKAEGKSFAISKRVVWEAYQRVKANEGAAGVDGESIEEFEQDLKGNLYKLWNRLSSGSYFPPPVRAVEIPKRDGQGVRMLGVPTVADRIAQTVVQLYLEPEVEPLFHPDSYGYRPGRSALRCGGRLSGAVLEIGLGDRSRHPSLLRLVDHELVLQGGSDAHRLAVDPALRGAVAEGPAATGGWHAGRSGSRYPAGLGDLTVAGQSLPALRVRCLDGAEFPELQFERYCDDVVVHCDE